MPFGAGSATDIDARLFADRLAARWGKSVVVDNRPGGDGLVAIGAFVGANDDHTLLFASAGTFTVHPYEHEKLPYDARLDLLPIASVAAVVLAISVTDNWRRARLRELAALARARPGKLNVAAAQGLSDFLLSGFLVSSGVEMARIPYRDILQAPNDLAEGRIQVLMTSLAVVLPFTQTGRVRVLAVNSRTRAPAMPQVPTAIEAGYPALTLEGMNGLFGPRGMSDELAPAYCGRRPRGRRRSGDSGAARVDRPDHATRPAQRNSPPRSTSSARPSRPLPSPWVLSRRNESRADGVLPQSRAQRL